MRRRWIGGGVVLLATMVACHVDESVVCPADPPRVQLTPDSLALAVGETATVQAVARICGGSELVPFSGRWRSSAPDIARIDSATRRVTGLAVGRAVIFGQYFPSSNPAGGTYDSVLVHVR